ncbi:hypothetical protein [Luteibacter sahnii]|uniref:hypothetical protein n=1 Tax=Luteibacter sahnii TaxID=3021977 RepID=UPI002A6A81C5|nr:hypothetical protein [Luteibacter sp. PPL193]MDY1546760.1 hypothetical protein [Luteibacter sp. PPL193]
MKKRRWIEGWLVLGAACFAVAATFSWVSAMSGFSLSYAACEGAFSLDASLVRCQRPMVFVYMFWMATGSSASLGVMAFYLRMAQRREKPVVG